MSYSEVIPYLHVNYIDAYEFSDSDTIAILLIHSDVQGGVDCDIHSEFLKEH